jgi:hypothetical protein
MHQSSVFVLSIAFQFALFGPGSSGPGSGCNVRCPGGPAEAARPQRHTFLHAPPAASDGAEGAPPPSPHRHSAPCNHHGPWYVEDCGIPDLCAGKLATGPTVTGMEGPESNESAFRTSQWPGGARWQEAGSNISRGGTQWHGPGFRHPDDDACSRSNEGCH